MTDPFVQELRDSVAFTAGVGHERRRIAERLRQRAADLRRGTRGTIARSIEAELCRLADELEEMV